MGESCVQVVYFFLAVFFGLFPHAFAIFMSILILSGGGL